MRSDFELKLQFDGLRELVDILNDIGLKYWIGGGTLLGIVRDGAFIKWDWDVEINVINEDFGQLKSSLVNNLKLKDFSTDVLNQHRNNKINATKYGSRYEIRVWYKNITHYTRRSFRLPKSFFEKSALITFNNYSFSVFTPEVDYLEYVYGTNWKIPNKTTLKKSYLSKRFRRRFIMSLSYIKKSLIKKP